MSEDLAYIIGVTLGDGHIHKEVSGVTAMSIQLRTTTKMFNDSFERSLKNIGLHPNTIPIKRQKPNWKDTWLTYAHSVVLCRFLKKIKGDSKRVSSLFDEDKLIISFIRGIWESEGGICQTKQYLCNIRIGMDDEELINILCSFINDLGFKSVARKKFDTRYNKFRPYLDVLGTKGEKIRFLETIDPVIKSKSDVY